MYITDAEHWSNPLKTKKSSGIGVYGGSDGAAGAAWLFPGETLQDTDHELLGIDGGAYRGSTPIAGVLDPETKEVDPAGEYHYFASTPIWRTKPSSVFRYLTNGGGGWGDPLERDPERVKNDVRDEYVSIAGAEQTYGVVVVGEPLTDPEGLVIDQDATDRRREHMRSARA